MQKLIYALLKLRITCVIYLFFKKVDVIGKENIPKEGPFIFAVNHQNSFLDALVVNVTNARNPIFITRGDVFKRKWAARLLAYINMIPIYRATDGASKMKKNEEIFEKCASILNEGNPILIFPEANHQYVYRIRPIKKGISRIAFSVRSTDKLVVIPVGIHYENYKRTGYPVVVRYGKPMHISDFMEDYRQNHNRGFQRLGQALGEKMRELVVSIPVSNYDQIFKLWQQHRKIQSDVRTQLQADQELIDKISNDMEPFPEKNEPPSRSNLIYFPFYAISCVVNFVPWLVSTLLLKSMKDDQYIASMKVAVWFLMAPEIIVLQAVLVGVVFDSAILGGGFLLVSLLSGWITIKRYFPL